MFVDAIATLSPSFFKATAKTYGIVQLNICYGIV